MFYIVRIYLFFNRIFLFKVEMYELEVCENLNYIKYICKSEIIFNF